MLQKKKRLSIYLYLLLTSYLCIWILVAVVVVNGIPPTPRLLACGVPQGSALGPILFTLYDEGEIGDFRQSAFFVSMKTFQTVWQLKRQQNSTLHNQTRTVKYTKYQRQQIQHCTGQRNVRNTNDNQINLAQDKEVCRTPTTTESTLHRTIKYAKHQRQQNQRITGQ